MIAGILSIAVMKLLVSILLLSVVFFTTSIQAQIEALKPVTALQALRIAQGVVNNPDARNTVAYIYGPRATTTLEPATWEILFFDAQARHNCRRVKVDGNQVVQLVDKIPQWLMIYQKRFLPLSEKEVIPVQNIRIDSNQALRTVLKTGALQRIALSSVIFILRRDREIRRPIWELEIFADRRGREVSIGYGYVAADNGELLNINFQIERVLGRTQKRD
jgi:hypothetical protein